MTRFEQVEAVKNFDKQGALHVYIPVSVRGAEQN